MHQERLRQSILRAQSLGFTGDDVDLIERHSVRFAEVCRVVAPVQGAAVDLGSGGGVPGFAIAGLIEGLSVLLVESMEKRVAFLREQIVKLGYTDRVEVFCGRAEVLGRDSRYRERFNLVTARGFGPPSATVEIGSALLALDGVMVVSEPPDSDGGRWQPEALREFGVEKLDVVRNEFSFIVFRKVSPLSGRYPRRTGIPFKRPIF